MKATQSHAAEARLLPARPPQTSIRARAPRQSRFDWLISLVVLLAGWELLCRTGLFPPSILVPPRTVVATFIELCESGDITTNLIASLRRLALGYVSGAIAGIAFGLLLGLVPKASQYLGMIFNMLRQIPVIALAPLLMLVFGIQETFKIVMIAVATFFPVALNTLDGTRGVPVAYLEVASALCLRWWMLIRRVILPASLPAIVTGLRVALSRAWLILVAAELFASSEGVGYLIDWGRQLFQLDIVMVGVLLAGLIGLVLDITLRRIERRLSRWNSQRAT